MLKQNWIFVLVAAALVPTVNCAAPEGDFDCSDGKCDDIPDSEVPDSPCDGIMKAHDGSDHQKVAGRLNDPVAKFAFRAGDSCPKTFQDIMKKLEQEDKEGCPNPGDGLSTRLISETAQAQGAPTSYRAVTSRRCGNRGTEAVLFSLFGVQAGATSMPGNVEIIAFDDTAGVFNYYETDGRNINFFGNSKDMLKGAEGENRRCANCHTGGGLIMKELDTPWLHWEGHMDTPGARELVDANKAFLGSKNSGAEFEGVVKGGNTKWNKTKIEHNKAAGLKELLRPLFCSVEVNLDNGADFPSPVAGGTGGDEIDSVPFDSLLDPQLKGFGSIPITFADYDAVIKANGQRVGGVSGAIDTVFDYTFVERSHADNDYINQLKQAGIIDDDFIKDVLMVDFTRHVFSSDRCGLLEFAPTVAVEDMTAAKIRDAYVAALEADDPTATSPAGVLLANLKAQGDAMAHNTKVDAFINACKALGSRPFFENANAITALNRNKAREKPVFEFEATMPTDNQSVNSNARLDPKTCQLNNSFVAP